MVQLSTSWTKLDTYTVDTYGFKGEFALWAKISETDVANNRTKVSYDWDFTLTYGWQRSYDAQDYVSGAGWNEATYREYSSSGTLRSGSEWINHNSDGTGSGTGYGRTRMGGMGFDTDWVGGSYTLPTIPRASVPTASPNPITLTIGTNTLTVNTNRKSSSFTHTVRADVWSFQQTKTGVGASTTFDIPYSVIGSIPNNVLQDEGTIYVKTYNGSTQIGDEKSCTFTLKVDTSHDHPNVGTITVEDTNTKTSAVLSSGQFAYGISTLKATIPLTVSGSYTQLASATVTCGTKSQTYTLSGTSQTIVFTFDKVDVSSLKVVVTDKRGTTATKTKSWTLLAYQPLTAIGTVGRPSSTGSTAVGQVSGVCYGGTYGGTANSLTIKVTSKLHSASTYGNTETYTQSISGTGQTTYTRAITFTHSFDYSQEYDIKFEVSDLFSTASYVCRLTQGLPILSWDATEVDVWGDLHVHYRDNPTYYYRIPESFNGVQYYDGIKNLMPNFPTGSTTRGGITFTVDDIGVVTANGTATEQTIYSTRFTWGYGTGNFYFSGCPNGGNASTYDTYMWDYGANARPKQWDQSTTILSCYGSDLDQSRQVYLVNSTEYNYSIRIEEGVTVSNLKFYPMIRHETIASNTFIPHAPTNRELETTTNSIRNSLEWKLMGSVSASTTYTFPITDFSELFVVAMWNESSSDIWKMTAYIPKVILSSTAAYIGATARISSTQANDFGCVFLVSLTTLRMYQFNANRSDITSAVTTYIYYR